MGKVSFIIVNYNLSSEIKDCIDSIYNKLGSLDFEIIIVDNNSIDEEKALLREVTSSRDNLKVIFLQENLGFGKASNIGAENSMGDFLFFLNPDTKIIRNYFNLVEDIFKTRDDTAIIGLNVSDRKLQDASAACFPNIFIEALNLIFLGNWLNFFYNALKKNYLNKHPVEVDWVTGACLLIKKGVFFELGGFNKAFFMFYEDMDLCFAAKKLGYKVIYLPQFRLFHQGSVSAKKNYFFFTKTYYKSKFVFFNKNYSGIKLKIINSIILIQLITQMILWVFLYPKNPLKSKDKLKAFKEMLFSYKELKKY